MINRDQIQAWVQISLVVAAAFLVRFVLAMSSALDFDEATAYAPAALDYLKGDWAVNTTHPMLIKLLFAGSVALFGADGRIITVFPWLPESIGALRLVSAIMGAATCLVIYWLVREMTDSHLLAVVSALLLAFDPISVAESSYGLLDPGMTLFYMLSILFFYRYVKDAKNLDLYASAVTFGLAVASKYFAFLAFFIFIGILVWKRKIRSEWKSIAVILPVSIIVFFAVQPYLWSNPFIHLSRSLIGDEQYGFVIGHLVKPPGNPFIIPQIKLSGSPWRYVGSNPIASKPDFYANLSDGVPSPHWYVLYIEAMYSTPFEIAIYPLAMYKLVSRILRRRANDLTRIAVLAVSIPTLWFVIESVRLPQYAVLPSTSAVLLGAIAFDGVTGGRRTVLLVSLVLFHVGWTLYALLTAGSHFTGWGYYDTFLTPIVANLFGLLWKTYH